MLCDKIMERFFSHPEMQKLSIETQSVIVKVFEEVIEQVSEEKPYAELSELLSDNISW